MSRLFDLIMLIVAGAVLIAVGYFIASRNWLDSDLLFLVLAGAFFVFVLPIKPRGGANPKR